MASLLELLRDRASGTPRQPAILAPGRPPATYADLVAQVDAFGASLAAGGVTRDAVAFLASATTAACAPLAADRPHAEHERDLAAMGARVLVVARDHDTAARDAARALGIAVVEIDAHARAGAFDARWCADATDANARADATNASIGSGARDNGGAALLLFTSGTTSRPKLVPITEAALVHSAAQVSTGLGLTDRDRCLNVMPLFHVHGLVAGLLASLAAGGSVICAPGFVASQVWGWIDELRPTWYTAVPTIHQAMLDATRARSGSGPVGSSLQFVRSSSSALPERVMHDLEEVLGVPVIEAYGMTEAAHQIASNERPPGTRRAGTVGFPRGCEVQVVDDDGGALPPGTVGEVVVRGPSITAGYLGDPAVTAAAFRDGWFRTGDQGRLDADGRLTLTGRLKEIINRGGEKVAPREIDEALLGHPEVKYAAAFGVPHPRLGEEVAAAVVLQEGATVTASQLRVWVADHLAPYKVPRRLVAVERIPMGKTGKLDRAVLAAQLGSLGSAGVEPARVAPADELERAVAEIWRGVLGDDQPPGVEEDFFELGGDSLHAVELLEQIERVLGRRLAATIFFEGATVRRMADELRTEPGDPSASSVVAVQPLGSRPPLFCVMRAGAVVTLRHLVRTLGPDQPVFGIWMPSMHGTDDVSGSVEELAAECAQLVRATRPEGPYALLGHSLGAIVAYEAARQLVAGGASVTTVVIADALHPAVQRAEWVRRHSTRYRLRKLVSRRAPAVVVWRVRRLLGRTPPRTVEHLPGTDAVVDWRAAGARERRYEPGPSPVPVTILATEQFLRFAKSPDLGWAPVLGAGWDAATVPGTHDSMIGEPHVHVLAAAVDAALRRVSSDAPVSDAPVSDAAARDAPVSAGRTEP
jgi:acyl-CoA synthetase (AMP-forming)/AMP-acid ligase II/thioesterase domain-containing protein/acyl carrier protein